MINHPRSCTNFCVRLRRFSGSAPRSRITGSRRQGLKSLGPGCRQRVLGIPGLGGMAPRAPSLAISEVAAADGPGWRAPAHAGPPQAPGPPALPFRPHSPRPEPTSPGTSKLWGWCWGALGQEGSQVLHMGEPASLPHKISWSFQ